MEDPSKSDELQQAISLLLAGNDCCHQQFMGVVDTVLEKILQTDRSKLGDVLPLLNMILFEPVDKKKLRQPNFNNIPHHDSENGKRPRNRRSISLPIFDFPPEQKNPRSIRAKTKSASPPRAVPAVRNITRSKKSDTSPHSQNESSTRDWMPPKPLKLRPRQRRSRHSTELNLDMKSMEMMLTDIEKATSNLLRQENIDESFNDLFPDVGNKMRSRNQLNPRPRRRHSLSIVPIPEVPSPSLKKMKKRRSSTTLV